MKIVKADLDLIKTCLQEHVLSNGAIHSSIIVAALSMIKFYAKSRKAQLLKWQPINVIDSECHTKHS